LHLHAAHASGWVAHHAVVLSSAENSGTVSRLAEKVDNKVLSAVKAADPMLSIECFPATGPFVSTSVLT
jgi:hypothetical protein